VGRVKLRQRTRPFSKRPRIVADDAKLRELVLFIASLCQGDPSFGAIKLAKLLFFADFLAYARFGKPITGQEYHALEFGPAPKRLKFILSQMVREKAAGIQHEEVFAYERERVVPLRGALVGAFTPEEVALTSQLVRAWWGRTADEISGFSHRVVGWRTAKRRETISYSTALVGTRPPTDSEREWGLNLEQFARQCLKDVQPTA